MKDISWQSYWETIIHTYFDISAESGLSEQKSLVKDDGIAKMPLEAGDGVLLLRDLGA